MNRHLPQHGPRTVSPLVAEASAPLADVRISLLNCFAVARDEAVDGIGRGSARDLLCYLALFRDRPHSRESLIETLWDDLPATAARKRLRQTLWQLKTVLGPRALTIDPSSVAYGRIAWLDVDVFEQAYRTLSVRAPATFTEADVRVLEQATEMYGCGLLPGMHQEWCVAERDRLYDMHMLMLEQLMDYFEGHNEYRTAIHYGGSILRLDPARESTHQRLMLLFHTMGDRTGALRQYQRCVAALDRELGVGISRATVDILRWIEGDETPAQPHPAHRLSDRIASARLMPGRR